MSSRGEGAPRCRALCRLVAIGAGLALSGCGKKAAAERLLLYCGAGIRPPVAEMAEEFGKRHGVKVECDYAGSNILLSRIKLSRRGDLYMPGDIHYVEQAEEEGLVHSKRTACYFIPVILVRKGNPRGIRGLADLARPEVKLGLGDPKACAIGRKSFRIFRKNGVPQEQVKRNVVFNSLTVNELGLHIKAGKVDAVIVWDATAAYYADVAEVVLIPPEENVISTVPVAVLSFSMHKDLAEKFARFVCSEEGKRIFRKHNYTTEGPK